jgi:hypothetical protein
VVQATQRHDLPEAVAAIPMIESDYMPEAQSRMCAKGLWQFMPETAHRLGLRIRDCSVGEGVAPWTPSARAPSVATAPYLRRGRCIIPPSNGCAVDERADIALSTEVALGELERARDTAAIARSGALVQLVIAAHTTGLDDSAFSGVANPHNLLPALGGFAAAHPDEVQRVYGLSAACEASTDACPVALNGEARQYVVEAIATHLVSVCYYGKNYAYEPAFRPYAKYVDGYCSNLGVPDRAALVRP